MGSQGDKNTFQQPANNYFVRVEGLDRKGVYLDIGFGLG